MKLPVTERGRVALAWKLLERITRNGEVSAGIKPGEPLTKHGCGRRDLQISRMLLDLQAAKRAAPAGGGSDGADARLDDFCAGVLQEGLEDLSRRCRELLVRSVEPAVAFMAVARFAAFSRALGSLVFWIEHDEYGRGLRVLVPIGALDPHREINVFPIKGLAPGTLEVASG